MIVRQAGKRGRSQHRSFDLHRITGSLRDLMSTFRSRRGPLSKPTRYDDQIETAPGM
jgi:hypothetical protein